MRKPFVSIIVPVLNEAELIQAFLRHLRALAPHAEIVVVDGGSDDGTAELSVGLADRVLTVSRGRARQMNAGANVARGEVFWFLHADSLIPANAPGEIARILRDDSNAGGCFRLRFPGREWIYRVSDSLGNLGVHIFGFALGDHGIFCRCRAFWSAGGFPEIQLMEDAECYRSLRRRGGMRQSQMAIVGNPRGYEQLGPYRTTLYYVVILGLYVLGAKISTLTSVYRRLTRGSRARAVGGHSASLPGLDSTNVFPRSTTAPSASRQ